MIWLNFIVGMLLNNIVKKLKPPNIMGLRSCFLIDDDEDDREIFELALKKAKADFVCSMAKNGKEAIDKAKTGDFVPGFIFIDLNMPLVSGREVVAAFKAIDRFANVPIVVYTTSSADNDIADIKALGAAHYMVKPSSFSALVSVLNDLFANKEMPFLLLQN